MPIRASALQIAEHCQLAEVLGREYPHHEEETLEGLAVDKEACRDLAGGPPAEHPDAKACAWWVRENMCLLGVQVPLELRDGEVLLSPGRADVVGFHGRSRVLTIVDFKSKGQWYASNLRPPDDNLQLHAYGMAAASREPRFEYQLCMLLFGDGAVQELWSRTYNAADTPPILDRIRKICAQKAALGDIRPQGHSGPHCLSCYQRRNCSHWLLPVTHAETALAPLASPGGLTQENAGRVFLAWQQAKELCDRVEVLLKDFAGKNGAFPVGEEKEWGPELQRGRRSASVSDLEGAGLQGYIRQGEPKLVYRLRRRR